MAYVIKFIGSGKRYLTRTEEDNIVCFNSIQDVKAADKFETEGAATTVMEECIMNAKQQLNVVRELENASVDCESIAEFVALKIVKD